MSDLSALTDGKLAHVIAECGEDLSRAMTQEHPDLFAASVFDDKLPFKVATAVVAQAPDSTAAQVRTAARASLWIFAADWQVDAQADSLERVQEIAGQCREAIEGGAVRSDLARFLADLREDVAASPAYATRGRLWREYFFRMMDAMEREWVWKTAATPDSRPTLDEYLTIADNFGSTWVNITYWLANDAPQIARHHARLVEASQIVQQILRLYNDLVTLERDRTWGQGDLNSLMVAGEDAVRRRIRELESDCREILAELEPQCPDGAAYLARQLEFSAIFYGKQGNDYWGALE